MSDSRAVKWHSGGNIENKMQRPIQTIYSSDAVRSFEHWLYSNSIVQPDELMQRAANAVCSSLLQNWPGAQKITILCGRGNNAGDGYILSKLLKQQDLDVQVVALEHPTHLTNF